LVAEYPDDLVVIGGVAVYLHTVAFAGHELPIEFTHDADIAAALVSLADLRDQYEVVPNRRLSKHQVTVGDTEIDLYVERYNDLRVDYPELAMAAVELEGIRVACLEHLLLLKLDALAARWRSAHAEKDRRDVAKLLVMLRDTEPCFALAHGTADDLDLLERVLRSDAFMQLARNNALTARRLRDRASTFVDNLKSRVS
jgi:hypothetical protein